jgi:phosphonate metabolism protein PhnN/1,5-bisphosphokinase (PRPP-forming)
MLHWEAHGFAYGLPRQLVDALDYGHSVVANVSRSVVAEARRKSPPTCVIAVKASPATLAARLGARGRETAAEIERRLERPGAISPGQADFVVTNEGLLAEAVDRFVMLLSSVAGQPAASG